MSTRFKSLCHALIASLTVRGEDSDNNGISHQLVNRLMKSVSSASSCEEQKIKLKNQLRDNEPFQRAVPLSDSSSNSIIASR